MSRIMGGRRWRSRGRFPWATTMLMVSVVVLVRCCEAATDVGDVQVMQALSKNLDGENVMGWNGDDPCKWKNVACSNDRIVGIQLENVGVKGNLPSSFNQLSALATLGLQHNQLSGSLPSFKGMSALQSAYLNSNNFTSIPLDFFSGLTSLQAVALDDNPLEPWIIPDDLKEAVMLVNFSASSAGVRGSIPEFFGDSLVSLQRLELAFNNLTGTIPRTFAGSNLKVLWLNNQVGDKLSGSIEVVAGMTVISQLWLQSNAFTGPIPDMSKCQVLQEVRLRDNMLTGLVPASLTMLPMLQNISLLNNALQGPYPSFPNTIDAEIGISSANSFCLPAPGNCDPRVNILLHFAEDIGYPYILASKWKGNDPCNDWLYVTCDPAGSIAVLNLAGLGLSGTISPALGKLENLTTLILSNNNLTGSIPKELAGLSHLQKLDVSNNKLSGKVPGFRSGVNVDVDGNTQIGKDAAPVAPVKAPPGSSRNQGNGTANAPANGGSDGGIVAKKGSSSSPSSSSSVGIVVGSAVGGLVGLGLIIGALGICLRKKSKKSGRVRSPNTVALHPQSSDPDTLKFTSMNSVTSEVSHSQSGPSSGHSDVHMVEAGNMIISIQVLRNVTDNFSEENVLGRGGFGVVYKGELHDGTKIAVKRMEAGVMSSKGLNEFQAEIAVLTKVRHRHLVALLGYCIEGTERLLVYEYMPQGPLSRHLFEWEKQNIRPLDWTKRLIIALDVARGVEYLHSLAQKSFIHRDLKPSNILLGDDMRAKVSDFGLVRLAPEGKCSVETRLAGTFGYLAPEYAVTGRVTTKADVFSFGVILMELITGRRALDESQPEESMHLVTWFRRMHINKETFRNAIDRVLEVTEETLKSICIVAELAGHCTAREPYQRPDMGHAVNVLSPLVEQWKPTDPDNEDYYGIDLDMTLPQALKKWQAFEDNSNVDDSVTSIDNSYSSIPTRPTGFADTFTSADGR